MYSNSIKYSFFIPFFLFSFFSCSSNKVDKTSVIKIKMPEQPLFKKNNAIENQKLPLIIASARYHGNKWGVDNWKQLEKWIERKVDNYLKYEQNGKAYELMIPYMNMMGPAFDIDHQVPASIVKQAESIMVRLEAAGDIRRTMHLCLFINKIDGERCSEKMDLLVKWLIEFDRLKFTHCLEEQDLKKRCYATRMGDDVLLPLISNWPGRKMNKIYWQYYAAIINHKELVDDISNWSSIIDKLPKHEQGRFFDRILWRQLIENEDLSFLKQIFSNSKNRERNSYLAKLTDQIKDNKNSVLAFHKLVEYFAVKFKSAYKMQICNLVPEEIEKSGIKEMCKALNIFSIYDSLQARAYLLDIININPSWEGAWDKLFKLTLMRFYKFIENEDLDNARKEVEFFQKIFQRMNQIWPDEDNHKYQAEIAISLSNLYQTRGNPDRARKILKKAFARSKNFGLLDELIKLEYWDGNYQKALDYFEEYNKISENRNYAMIRYMLMGSYLGRILDRMGKDQRAKYTRMKIIRYLGKIVKAVKHNQAKNKIMYVAGNLYLELGRPKMAVQIYQYIIERQGSCSNLMPILRNLSQRGYFNDSLDIYYSILGSKMCSENRKVYASFLIYLQGLQKKAESSKLEIAVNYINSYRGSKWLEEIANYISGKTSFAALLSNADSPGRKTEAWFYGALKVWGEKGWKEAKKRLAKATSQKVYIFIEHFYADFLLSRKQD
jgi:tetratricopeptide (TPR) repeat protein